MDFWMGRKMWPFQRGGLCREVAVSRGSTVVNNSR